MTTIPAPVGLLARAACAMKRVPSAAVRLRSREPAEPPAIGGIGGRESLSTHIWPPCSDAARYTRQRVCPSTRARSTRSPGAFDAPPGRIRFARGRSTGELDTPLGHDIVAPDIVTP